MDNVLITAVRCFAHVTVRTLRWMMERSEEERELLTRVPVSSFGRAETTSAHTFDAPKPTRWRNTPMKA